MIWSCAMSPRVNYCGLPVTVCHQHTNDNWSAIGTVQRCSKWIMPCRRQSHGKPQECLRAATVHIGGTMEEIAVSEDAMRHGHHAERPFVLLAQPTLFDPSRAPEGRHVAWAYCHVPNGSTFDMLPRLEAQVERFAPGFRECVLERRIFSPAALEAMDANLVGGDIGGGAVNLRQFLFRPTRRHYATSARDIYLCSSSTPPGGGVHGMCGFNAAKFALSRL